MTGGQPLRGCGRGRSAAGRGGKRTNVESVILQGAKGVTCFSARLHTRIIGTRQDRDVAAEEGGAAADTCNFHLHFLPCRGIDVVRNKIKMFAQKKVTLPPGRHKIVILDEADRCSADPPASVRQLLS